MDEQTNKQTNDWMKNISWRLLDDSSEVIKYFKHQISAGENEWKVKIYKKKKEWTNEPTNERRKKERKIERSPEWKNIN